MTDVDELSQEFDEAIERAAGRADIDAVRRRFLGRRSTIKTLFRELGSIEPGERKRRAQLLNALSERMEAAVAERLEAAGGDDEQARLRDEAVDVTLPGGAEQGGNVGAWHPITEVERRCLAVLGRLGFEFRSGPEVEDAYHNFDALNIPPHHPARDLQDTFWLADGKLLRSHTTTVQIRELETGPALPIKVASAGRVYRNEAVDATHLAMFHQLEGFWVEQGLTLSHLKGVLEFVTRELYGPERLIRFKPKYYPYTEPSIGLDISCAGCQGRGCGACHMIGWVTLIGAGMIHPDVLARFGYNHSNIRGFAFGWGTTRMTAQLLGLTKVRRLHETKQRQLEYLNRGTL